VELAGSRWSLPSICGFYRIVLELTGYFGKLCWSELDCLGHCQALLFVPDFIGLCKFVPYGIKFHEIVPNLVKLCEIFSDFAGFQRILADFTAFL
jgi:hypothetical protein